MEPAPLEVATWSPSRLRPVPDRFRFAGVRFRVEREPGTPALALPAGMGAPVAEPSELPVAAEVHLRLSTSPGLPRERCHRRFRARCGDAGLEVDCGRGRAELRRGPGGVHVGHGTVAADTFGAAELDLLHAAAAAVVSVEGGALLHAAAVELDGAVCAFVGPPDAGKSTAREHVPEGRVFAVDRVMAWPHDGGLWAWSVPAGIEDESALPLRSAPALPLRAVLRVVQSKDAVRARRLGGARATTTVRAALQWPFGGPAGEAGALDAAQRIARGAIVGEIHTVLGRSNTAAVRALAQEKR